MTYGDLIAGTGTMGPDGSIGEIGGLAPKAFLAEQAGPTGSLCPPGRQPRRGGWSSGSR